jgi:hypothetical protein
MGVDKQNIQNINKRFIGFTGFILSKECMGRNTKETNNMNNLFTNKK